MKGVGRRIHVRKDTTTRFGATLRAMRLGKLWEYEDVAVRSKFSRSYMVQIELGRRLPTREVVVALARAFELDAAAAIDLALAAAADRLMLY